MICQNCDHDGPRQLMRLVILRRPEFPYVEFLRVCRRCRRELRLGVGNRLLILLFLLAVIAAVAAAGFAIVYLVQWLTANASAP